MTPERKEKIKTFVELGLPNDASRGYCEELLATLEETEQENEALRRSLTKEACTNASNARELAEAQQRNVSLNEESLANFREAAKRGKELAEAQQTIARQREALEFYATQGNHKWSHTYDETGEVEEIYSKVTSDRGRIAREALGEGAKESC